MTVQAGAAGATAWQWDGLAEDGSPAPAGRYSIRATAGGGEGGEGLDVRLAARVDSVSIEPSGLVLNLSGLGSHPLSAIRRLG
ncbi:flagellar hook assembly protein FlgD [Lysobacter sp. A3-1-A15]